MSKNVNQYLQDKVNQRKEKNAFRVFKINEGLVDFCSNDYLGFAQDKEIANQLAQEIEKYEGNINGSTGARTITGTSQLILDLEQQIAVFHKTEAALFYNSGYTANLGLFSALPYRGDTILYDELIHASIRDGMKLGRARAYSFKHNDLESLEKRLQRAEGNIYVAVESIYSMDGDMAPLKEIAELCKKYDAALIVDEAHSNGIFGEGGRGLVDELGLENDVFARVMTFGKAIGSHGAIVVGSQILKDFLINYSRPFIFTTAPSIHQVLGVKIAYDNLSLCQNKILKIRELLNLFKLKVGAGFKIEMIESFSPIQCVIVPGNDKVKALCAAIQKDGFDVRPIVAPTVPEGKERIRICIHAFNTEEEIIALTESIKKNYNQL